MSPARTLTDDWARVVRMCRKAAIRPAALARLPFADAQFDGVVCCGVIQYYRDPTPVLAEFARVLAPSGWAVVDTLNRRSWLRRAFRAYSGVDFPYQFDVPSLVRAGEAAGFRAERAGLTFAPTGFTALTAPGSAGWLDPLASNFALVLRRASTG